jgi:hypothetical protein
MTDQDIFVEGPSSSQPVLQKAPKDATKPGVLNNGVSITFPPGFQIVSVDNQVQARAQGTLDRHAVSRETVPQEPLPPLSVLENFQGKWIGTGFNTIFRPKNAGSDKEAKIKVSNLNGLFDDNILQLNLTTEQLNFGPPLGNVPNRGLGNLPGVPDQEDVFLNGVSYVQTIQDVTSGVPAEIHFEPGLWMHVPNTKNPKLGATLSRMASIPHGTVINAQAISSDPTSKSFVPKVVASAEPNFPQSVITPFSIANGQPQRFPSQDVAAIGTSRIPQDLTSFAGTIDQEVLDNPNVVLARANKGKNFVKTIEFEVTTEALPGQAAKEDGIANIAFLEGGPRAPGNPTFIPNADATKMRSTFWISTVKHNITVPLWKEGQGTLFLDPIDSAPGIQTPKFSITPEKEITAPKTIEVESTQIQYSQRVILDFFGLSWPHVSVATLIPNPNPDADGKPLHPVIVPASALDKITDSPTQ